MSKTGAKIADEINPKKLIPVSAPKDIFEKAQKAGFSSGHYIVFRRNGAWDKEQKRYHFTGHCTACNKTIDIDYYEADARSEERKKAFKTEVRNNAYIFCPNCKKRVIAKDRAQLKWGFAHSAYCAVLVFKRVNDKVVAVAYALTRDIDKDGIEKRYCRETDAYIFGYEKPVRFGKWECSYYGMGQKYSTSRWEYKPSFTDGWMTTDNFIYPLNESLFVGTCLENSKVVQYLNNSRDARLMKYCQQYLLYPGIENLLMQGYISFIWQKINGSKVINAAINWREVSPKKMLGLDKQEIKRIKTENWDASMLFAYKWLRDNNVLSGKEINAALLRDISYEKISKIEIVAKKINVDVVLLFKYLSRQVRKNENHYGLNYYIAEYEDYINVGKRMDFDFSKANVLMPPDLIESHDRTIKACELEEDKAKRKQFKQQYEKLNPLTWQHGDFIIRPAKSEKELIYEGECLEHCVGTYGQQHLDGKSIFFIRWADKPNLPYYTLQLDIKKKEILTNLGYKNSNPSLGGEVRPKHVDDFASLWLENIVKQYDFKTKKFKKNKQVAVDAA